MLNTKTEVGPVDTEKSMPEMNSNTKLKHLEIEDEKIKDQLQRESEPMAITDQMLERPIAFLSIGLFILLIFAVLSIKLGYFEIAPQGKRDFLIWQDDKVVAWDMQILAKEYLEEKDGSAQKPERTQANDMWTTLFIFDNSLESNYGVISKESLLKI